MTLRRAASAFVIAALLLSAGGPAFCVPATRGSMPCCKSAESCGAGMKAADCCRLVPAAPTQAPAAVEASLVVKISRQGTQGAAHVDPAQDVLAPALVPAQASPPPFLLRDSSVPLYILNTSLLR